MKKEKKVLDLKDEEYVNSYILSLILKLEKAKKIKPIKQNSKQKMAKIINVAIGDVFYNPQDDYFGIVSWVTRSGSFTFKKKGQSTSIPADFTVYDVKWATGFMHKVQKEEYVKWNNLLSSVR
jgi:hypothetical protein